MLSSLNTTRRNMVAASLEIDGRPDVAAAAVVTGHISEFTYRRGIAESQKAKDLQTLTTELETRIQFSGLDAVISELRSGDPIAALFDWKDLSCMGGDELRVIPAADLALMLTDALRAGATDEANRALYYLRVAMGDAE